MKISDLENVGLSKKEARAYLATLEIGSGTAFGIAKKIGVPKSTAHDILAGLVSKGLMSTYMKKNKKYFAASEPEMLGEKSKRELEAFEKILPELNALAYKGVGKPKVRFFDNKTGMEVVIKEMYAEAKELISYGDVESLFREYPEYFPKYMEGRIKHKIITRSILFDSEVARKLKGDDPKSLRKSKVVKKFADESSVYWIWNDKFVLFNTVGDHSVLIVEDKRFTALVRGNFELLWSSLPE